METLTEEEVMHAAYLARLALSDIEKEKFKVQLKQILNEVSKITEITGYDSAMMFTPVLEDARVRSDEVGKMLSPEEALLNAPARNGNFMEVPVMIHE